jgi:hypothetical protein
VTSVGVWIGIRLTKEGTVKLAAKQKIGMKARPTVMSVLKMAQAKMLREDSDEKGGC